MESKRELQIKEQLIHILESNDNYSKTNLKMNKDDQLLAEGKKKFEIQTEYKKNSTLYKVLDADGNIVIVLHYSDDPGISSRDLKTAFPKKEGESPLMYIMTRKGGSMKTYIPGAIILDTLMDINPSARVLEHSESDKVSTEHRGKMTKIRDNDPVSKASGGVAGNIIRESIYRNGRPEITDKQVVPS